MRSALTMIELIFVIIILGVLVSAALPKLASTRDDAKIATIAQQVQGAVEEIMAVYTATGVIKKPHEMSKVLAGMVHAKRAFETSIAPIVNSVGQVTIYSQDGLGVEDHPFVFDINQSVLVFKHSTPCVGIICKTLQKRVSEGSYTIGSNIVF